MEKMFGMHRDIKGDAGAILTERRSKMKRTLWIILVGSLVLGSPFTTLAGMNHQPHNAKKFMGFERKAKAVISVSSPAARDTRDVVIRKNPHKKGVDRLRIEK